jgi:hypothetical protein
MATGKSKADFVTDVLNKTLHTCYKLYKSVRNYFDIGVIGYGGSAAITAVRFKLPSETCCE